MEKNIVQSARRTRKSRRSSKPRLRRETLLALALLLLLTGFVLYHAGRYGW